MRKSKLWLGLSGVMVFILTVMLSLTILANTYAGYINDVLGLTTSGLTLKGSSYGDENGELTDAGYERLIKDSYELCTQLEEQGSVLLRNDGALPLKDNERNVTLFGGSSAEIRYRSGAGGPTPNNDYVIDLGKAFKDAGFNINQMLYNKYDEYMTENRRVDTNRVGEVPISFYTPSLKATFDEYNDAAIVTFARYGTENIDPTLGIMKLDPKEEALLEMINDSGKFDKIIVLLSGPLPMELGWLDKYNVNACLWFGNPGYYGLPGVANVVSGKANPSGHSVFTFAANSMGSPAMANFGSYTFSFDGSAVDNMYGTHYVVYKEGIYVGYKYYETRYEDAVLNQGNATSTTGALDGATAWNYADEVCFPFGYGLSYSQYTQTLDSVNYNSRDDKFTANVTVKNTNNMAGKSVVQIFAQQPYTDYDKQNGVEKSAIQLMDYEKVDVPANGEVKVSVEFDRYLLASYDSSGDGGYILEPGDYYFAVGNGAHEALNNIIGVKKSDAKLVDHDGKAYTANTAGVKVYKLEGNGVDRTTYKQSPYDKEVTVDNKFEDADLNYWADDNQKITYLTRKDWAGTFPTTVKTLHANEKIVDGLRMDKYKKAADAPSYEEGEGTVYSVELADPIDFADMKGVAYDDPKWDEFVSQLSLKELCISIGDARGIAGVAAINKPGNSIAEGPEGILAKFKYGDKRAATGFPTLPTVTATWDHKMQSKYGDLFAEEALFCGVAMINAPGCNIIRTPYSSRASEYMSEDGMLSYYSVSNIIYAMREKGLICNVKHCFLNEQETHRQGVATFSNEQAIREIYLRPFEGALTRGHSLGIMTSYNRIGLQYAATHSVLMQDVMRGEWAYRGSIIDDALAQSQYYCSTPDMLMAGTNIFCLDAARSSQMSNLITSTDDGTLLKKLQESNKWIFYALVHSSMAGSIDENYVYTDKLEWWQSTLIAVDVVIGVIAAGAIVMFVLGTYLKKKEEN